MHYDNCWDDKKKFTGCYVEESVHSPLFFFRKIIKIECFLLWAAILHDCQNYLSGVGAVWEEERKKEGL